MPSKKKPVATLPSIPKELIDQSVSGPMSAEAVNDASMAFKYLARTWVQRGDKGL
jgi:hypothetical protein